MTHTHPKFEALLRAIVSCICRRTKSPQIEWDEERERWEITVAAADQGRMIGKKGITIWAVETFLWYAGLAHGITPEQVILITQKGTYPSKSPFKLNPKWDRKAIGALVDAISSACLKKSIPWVLTDGEEAGEAVLSVELEKYLQTAMSNPSFAEALEVIVHAASMADGASVKVEVLWK